MSKKQAQGLLLGGIILVGVGIIFLLSNFNVLGIDMHKLWPLIPLMIGLVLVFMYFLVKEN